MSESVLELHVLSEGTEHTMRSELLDMLVLSSEVVDMNNFRLAVLWSSTSKLVLLSSFDISLHVEGRSCTS